jgi:hypothetical protein
MLAHTWINEDNPSKTGIPNRNACLFYKESKKINKMSLILSKIFQINNKWFLPNI